MNLRTRTEQTFGLFITTGATATGIETTLGEDAARAVAEVESHVKNPKVVYVAEDEGVKKYIVVNDTVAALVDLAENKAIVRTLPMVESDKPGKALFTSVAKKLAENEKLTEQTRAVVAGHFADFFEESFEGFSRARFFEAAGTTEAQVDDYTREEGEADAAAQEAAREYIRGLSAWVEESIDAEHRDSELLVQFDEARMEGWVDEALAIAVSLASKAGLSEEQLDEYKRMQQSTYLKAMRTRKKPISGKRRALLKNRRMDYKKNRTLLRRKKRVYYRKFKNRFREAVEVIEGTYDALAPVSETLLDLGVEAPVVEVSEEAGELHLPVQIAEAVFTWLDGGMDIGSLDFVCESKKLKRKKPKAPKLKNSGKLPAGKSVPTSGDNDIAGSVGEAVAGDTEVKCSDCGYTCSASDWDDEGECPECGEKDYETVEAIGEDGTDDTGDQEDQRGEPTESDLVTTDYRVWKMNGVTVLEGTPVQLRERMSDYPGAQVWLEYEPGKYQFLYTSMDDSVQEAEAPKVNPPKGTELKNVKSGSAAGAGKPPGGQSSIDAVRKQRPYLAHLSNADLLDVESVSVPDEQLANFLTLAEQANIPASRSAIVNEGDGVRKVYMPKELMAKVKTLFTGEGISYDK